MNKDVSAREALLDAVRQAARQEQFLEVVSAEAARARFQTHLALKPLAAESVSFAAALTRVLAHDVIAPVDAPAFDRSNVDGFALRAADTVGASDSTPRRLTLNAEVIACGHAPALTVAPGTASTIATGGMLPRGADAVVMVEHTELAGESGAPAIAVSRTAPPGQFVSYAGSDIARGETLLRKGTRIGSREIGMLAACGLASVDVVRRPQVAVLSTGDELVSPGVPLHPGGVYDSNGAIIAAAITEAGGEPIVFGIVGDDETALAATLRDALARCDMVVLSGGTSKGAGDLSHRVVSRLGSPGILVHGVALKPGKPLCLAVTDGKPVAVLPGFPTSAIFTFHSFVAPVIRALAGLPAEAAETVTAEVPVRIASEMGRQEFVLVSLVAGDKGPVAFPTPKGSGSVTAFSQADGFLAIDALASSLDAGSRAEVTRIGTSRMPDIVITGSHDVALDVVLGRLAEQGFSARTIVVGSQGGVSAAERGECDLAPVHLLDPAGKVYNRHLLRPGLALVQGWRRMQGFVFRPGDIRFAHKNLDQAVAAALADPACLMVNRNAGAGTRFLIDHLLARFQAEWSPVGRPESAPTFELGARSDAKPASTFAERAPGKRPPGYANQPKSHNAVAAAVAQGRADWGVAIEAVARMYGLAFLPLAPEHYDFLLVEAKRERPAVQAFLAALRDPEVRARISALGMVPADED